MDKMLATELRAKYGPRKAATVAKAIAILESLDDSGGDRATSPAEAREYLRLRLAHLPYEAFWCVWLNAQNRAIASDEMFRGTLTQTSVYPREIVKRALHYNAAAVLFSHNHPSGNTEPSFQDQALTRSLSEALALVDVKVLDHIIIAGRSTMSFAERGLL